MLIGANILDLLLFVGGHIEGVVGGLHMRRGGGFSPIDGSLISCCHRSATRMRCDTHCGLLCICSHVFELAEEGSIVFSHLHDPSMVQSQYCFFAIREVKADRKLVICHLFALAQKLNESKF